MTKRELIELLQTYLGVEIPSASMISSQIDKYNRQYEFTNEGIACAVCYYFTDKYSWCLGNKFEPKYGIGIVPNVIAIAERLFNKEQEQREMLKREGDKLKEMLSTPKKEVKVTTPKWENKNINIIDLDKL